MYPRTPAKSFEAINKKNDGNDRRTMLAVKRLTDVFYLVILPKKQPFWVVKQPKLK